MNIRIGLADDHPVVLAGITTLIDASAVGEIVLRAEGVDSLIGQLEHVHVDVLVTDFCMPGSKFPDGMDMLTFIRSQYPELPIVLLSMLANLQLLDGVRKLGVLGLVDKASSLEEIVGAILASYRRKEYVCSSIAHRFSCAGISHSSCLAAPSAREMQVLELLGSGMSSAEVAEELGLSYVTISRHKNEAMRKLGLKSRADLYAYVRSAKASA